MGARHRLLSQADRGDGRQRSARGVRAAGEARRGRIRPESAARNTRSTADRYAVIIPGSAQVSKCWPAERFAALADRLASEHGLTVVATGGKSESPMIEQIRSLAKHPIANLAGQTSLPELVEVLRQAKLVVSNDTGPGHIAAALGRPLVMMFSWSNPLRVGPYGRPECIVGRDMCKQGPRDQEPRSQARHSAHHLRRGVRQSRRAAGDFVGWVLDPRVSCRRSPVYAWARTQPTCHIGLELLHVTARSGRRCPGARRLVPTLGQ